MKVIEFSWNISLHWNKDFIGTCACSENRDFPEIFTVLNIVFTFRIFEQLVLSLKNRVCPEFTVLNIYFLSFRILNNLRMPWKQSLPWIFQAGGASSPLPPASYATARMLYSVSFAFAWGYCRLLFKQFCFCVQSLTAAGVYSQVVTLQGKFEIHKTHKVIRCCLGSPSKSG